MSVHGAFKIAPKLSSLEPMPAGSRIAKLSQAKFVIRRELFAAWWGGASDGLGYDRAG